MSAKEQGARAPGAGRRHEQVGVVVSAKMQKSDPVYHKTIRRTSTFMAHDEKGARKGDKVRIVETRPLSKRKRWRVAEILGRAVAVEDTADVQVPEAGR
ncbi:MAG: 30S ribosomal protein S17 [Acidobacteria bacterium]|nr:MAG: 30S ribosomal protein S17 [Acidobacteriota bacterium]